MDPTNLFPVTIPIHSFVQTIIGHLLHVRHCSRHQRYASSHWLPNHLATIKWQDTPERNNTKLNVWIFILGSLIFYYVFVWWITHFTICNSARICGIKYSHCANFTTIHLPTNTPFSPLYILWIFSNWVVRGARGCLHQLNICLWLVTISGVLGWSRVVGSWLNRVYFSAPAPATCLHPLK